MARVSDKLSVITLAILNVGEPQPQSLADESFAMTLALQNYEAMRDMLLASYAWRFATKVRKLLETGSDPDSPAWRKSFRLPPDYITAQTILDKTGRRISYGHGNTDTQQDYEVFGRELWTNEDAVWLQYTASVDESQWPNYFSLAASFRLAGLIVLPLTENERRMRDLNSQAEGIEAKAKTKDAQARPPVAAIEDPLVLSRVV